MSTDNRPPPPRQRSRAPIALVGLATALGVLAIAVPSGPTPTPGAGAPTPSTIAAALVPRAFSCAARVVIAPDGADADTPAAVPAVLAPLRDALYAAHAAGDRVRGAGERVECRGGEATSAYRVVWRFDLERVERVRTLDGHVTINAFESRHTVDAPREARLVDDTVVAESISLPAADAWRTAPDGDGLVATRSARRAGAAGCAATLVRGCTARVDIGWRVHRAGPEIALEQTFWVNGRAAERVVWRLTI